MPGPKHILLIGSADPMAGIPYQALPRRWYRVAIVADEQEALQRLQQEPPDLVLWDATVELDNLLPICTALRDQTPPLPLIMFAASRAHAQQLTKSAIGLSLCVALVKPCPPTDLKNAVSKLVRQVRQHRRAVPPLYAGPLTLDLGRRLVHKNGQPVTLTPKQYDLLVLLVRHAGQVVTRQTIMEEIWQTNWMGDTRTLDVHIRMIRRSIEEDPSQPHLVCTVRGRGYVFQVPTPEDGAPKDGTPKDGA
ncbi:MAG: response regulator transcription factor [Chloroflexi bacterium]|nr:response regulator transcription factor [Chloroflexota bacterium]MBU1750646.1 response regulator transcription factor [Chloroflexota bacterium]